MEYKEYYMLLLKTKRIYEECRNQYSINYIKNTMHMFFNWHITNWHVNVYIFIFTRHYHSKFPSPCLSPHVSVPPGFLIFLQSQHGRQDVSTCCDSKHIMSTLPSASFSPLVSAVVTSNWVIWKYVERCSKIYRDHRHTSAQKASDKDEH